MLNLNLNLNVKDETKYLASMQIHVPIVALLKAFNMYNGERC